MGIWLTVGIIVIFGLVGGLLFLLQGKWRINKRIKHYEKLRDELSTRKPKAVDVTTFNQEDYSGSGGGLLGNVMIGFILILVGVNLIPIITEEIDRSIESVNTTTASIGTSQVLNMIPIVFISMIIFVLIGGFSNILAVIRNLRKEEKEIKSDINKRIDNYEKLRDGLTRR